MINGSFDEIMNALAVRKKVLIEQLEEISKDKIIELNEKYQTMIKNSDITNTVL